MLNVANDLRNDSQAGASRVSSRFLGMLEYRKEQAMVMVLEISQTFIRLRINKGEWVPPNLEVQFLSPETGHIEGVVAWCKGTDIGIELMQNTKTQANMTAYFRNFHPELRRVLKW